MLREIRNLNALECYGIALIAQGVSSGASWLDLENWSLWARLILASFGLLAWIAGLAFILVGAVTAIRSGRLGSSSPSDTGGEDG